MSMNLRRLLSGTRRPRLEVQVYDVSAPTRAAGDGAIRGNEVALWRPPVLLDSAGRTMPGVRKDLVAHYLVSTVSALAETDLGPVTVEWTAQEGRFVTTRMTIHAWNQAVTFLHPVAVISQKLSNALEPYRAGIILKARELHKGHQRFDEANSLLRRASRHVERLRDDRVPHLNDAEYLFVQAAIAEALVLSALIPVAKTDPEQTIGTRATVEATGG